ncbi:MAG TPA: FAD-dependent monooxygenase [Trebonia sp.]
MIDVLVVGGGPVGLATAIRCARAGLSVTVAEPRATPVDKACGEGVMPAAVRRLAALGVTPDGYPLRGIRYLDARHRADAPFRHGDGLGVRRTVLHAALAARAAALGIPVIPARVTTFERHPEHVTAAGVEARYLVAADGLHSTIRRLLEREALGPGALGPRALGPRALGRGAAAVHQGGAAFGPGRGSRSPLPRYGLRRHFRVAPWTDLVEVYWTPEAEAYVTPVSADVVGISLLFGRPPGGGAAGRDGDGSLEDGQLQGGPLGGEQLEDELGWDGRLGGEPGRDGLGGDGRIARGPSRGAPGRAAPVRAGTGDGGPREAAGRSGPRVETDSDGTREAAGRTGTRIAAAGDETRVTAGGDFAARLAAFPALRERLGDAPPASEVRGAGPMRQKVRRRVYGRVLLVGDASGYVDALTGEGIGVGLTQAEALAACLAADRPADYERAWRRASGPAWRFTAGLLWSRNQPLLGPRIVPAAQHLPWLFTALVNHAAQA